MSAALGDKTNQLLDDLCKQLIAQRDALDAKLRALRAVVLETGALCLGSWC